VSWLSRAGGRQGVQASKQWYSSSISGRRDDESDFAEAADDVLGHWVSGGVCRGRGGGRAGEVGGFLGRAAFKVELGAAFGEAASSSTLAALMSLPAAGRSSFERVPSCFISAVNFALRPDPGALGLFERRGPGRGFQFRQGGLFERFDLVNQSGHKFSKRLATKERKRHKEKFQETSNIEHPMLNIQWRASRLDVGCSMLGVGCFHLKGNGRTVAGRRRELEAGTLAFARVAAGLAFSAFLRH